MNCPWCKTPPCLICGKCHCQHIPYKDNLSGKDNSNKGTQKP